MEHGDPPPACPAPAITRGLRLLELLAVDGQASLERLTHKTGWPKSSVLRYLQALESVGAASQDPGSKAWTALLSLRRITPEFDPMLEFAKRQLPYLSQRSGHCAELYSLRAGHLELIDRAEPEVSDMALVARIGFTRDLSELDATATLFYAGCGAMIPQKPFWRWANGSKKTLSPAVARRALQIARKERFAVDTDFNNNGIKRFARPLFDEGDSLVGILAIAQRLTPTAKRETNLIAQALKDSTLGSTDIPA